MEVEYHVTLQVSREAKGEMGRRGEEEGKGKRTAVLIAVRTVIVLIRATCNIKAAVSCPDFGTVRVVTQHILKTHVVLSAAGEDVVRRRVIATGLPGRCGLDAPAAEVLVEVACCVGGHVDEGAGKSEVC